MQWSFDKFPIQIRSTYHKGRTSTWLNLPRGTPKWCTFRFSIVSRSVYTLLHLHFGDLQCLNCHLCTAVLQQLWRWEESFFLHLPATTKLKYFKFGLSPLWGPKWQTFRSSIIQVDRNCEKLFFFFSDIKITQPYTTTCSP